eukprot:TRINITY_DN2183_c0_g2_i1.p1 TRINITY_DN2183_c0_g2~~TRINITY_DN2183_c0_g2_i1.p1  ORF type:complete len:156 (+),score=19.10 TRINITY_DN2183_c0_g2_i1:24-470(+)
MTEDSSSDASIADAKTPESRRANALIVDSYIAKKLKEKKSGASFLLEKKESSELLEDTKKKDDTKATKLPQLDGEDDEEEDDPELGSDLDDSEEEDVDTDNLVLCQYELVGKLKKGKRKCKLKDGIMHLNGTDYVFSRGDGQLDWMAS